MLALKQACIPVGCILPTAIAVMVGLHTHPRAGLPEQTPHQSRHPWSRHPLARSSSTSCLGVGLDQIPLNFPLGCWPGDPPPSKIPLNFPLGCWPGNLQGMLGYHSPLETCCKACWDTTCNACWNSTPLFTDTHL